MAGHEATVITYSFWLLAFSMFIFLSLALVKRFTELKRSCVSKIGAPVPKKRGYVASDLELVAMLGIANGFMAVLVMALYVNSPEAQIRSRHGKKSLPAPDGVAARLPVVAFLDQPGVVDSAQGANAHDDPIVFALKDRVSYLIGAC